MIYVTYNRDSGALLNISNTLDFVDLPLVCEQRPTVDLSREIWSMTMRLFVPKVSRRISKQQFIDRFTPVEMSTILDAAKVNVAVEAWLFRFNSVTPDADGTSIDLDDARTIESTIGLEQAGLIGAGRAAEILG